MNKSLRISLLACALFSKVLHAELPFLPPDCVVTGKVTQTEAGLVAAASETERSTARLEGSIPDEMPVFVLKGRTGKGKHPLTIELQDAEGKSSSLHIRALDHKIGENVYEDAYLSIGGLGGWNSYYVRPNPNFYHRNEWPNRVEAWKKLPPASEHPFTVELRPVDGGKVEVWIDKQFIRLQEGGVPVSYKVYLAPGSTVHSLELTQTVDEKYRTLPVEWQAREGKFANAQLKFDGKTPMPEAFRKWGDKPIKGIAVGGLGSFNKWATDDLQNFFWRRNALNNMPEQRMFTVPQATYSHAWVLCAVEENGLNEFTFRLTRYGNSRGNAVADTLVEVSEKSAKKVGSVRYGDKSREAALWLVRVPVRNGMIQDVLHNDTKRATGMGTHEYLDVELLDPMENVEESQVFPPPSKLVKRAWKPTDPEMKDYDIYTAWPEPQTSGVHVFGIALEKSPVEMEVLSNTGVQAFYAAENPEFLARVKAHEAGTYQVEWDVADISEKIVESGKSTVTLKAGEEQIVRIPVKQGNGWYALRVRLSDSVERIDYRSSFVMLPPDTRKAGYESPFYGWWFQKNQGSDAKLEEVGPLLQKLGIRRVELTEEMPESLTQKYGFTNSTIGFAYVGGGRALRDFRDGKLTLKEAVAMHEEFIQKHLDLWPSIDRMLVFHESGSTGAPYPPSELWGAPAVNYASNGGDATSPEALLRAQGGSETQIAATDDKSREAWEKNWPKRIEYLTAMSKMVREKFPQLKMQWGNDGDSLGIMGELFRQKFPRKYMDTVATEDLGQTFAPERVLIGAFHSAWFLRELARKMGYGDVPLTACTEWIGRMTERLGPQKQAEWKARDGLIALAYGFDTISIAGINDASSAYYYSIWGGGGLTGRYPIMAPKPSYAAIATLTQVLDSAKFVRFVPSGSTVLYVQEFQRGDEWIYAVWTPRGERDVTLTFDGDSKRRIIDLYGREITKTGESVKAVASTGVRYFVSKEQLKSVELGSTRFPDDLPPKESLQEIPLDSLAKVEIIDFPTIGEQSRLRPENIPQKRQGKFEIREVEDPEMGACLEIELIPEKELRWDMEHEYVALKLKSPVTTKAKNAGIWIKGNGSWGDVDLWKTQSWGPWATNGNLHIRWPGEQTMNFEGWNFVRYPYYDWIREINNSVQGLILTFPRKALVGTDMQPVENLKVRIKKIVLF